MACLLVLVVAATVLTGPPGKLTHAARTSPAEAFWRAALSGGAPMPEAVRGLLRPGAAGTNALDDARPRDDGDDPPPISFKYDDYRSSLRNKAAAPSAEVLDRVAVAGAGRNAAASSETVFFLEDAVRVGGTLPFRSVIPQASTASAGAAAAAASPPPLRLYKVRAVRAVDGHRVMVCRRDGDERDAVYGCHATGPARAYVVGMVGERGGETVTAAVVCRTGAASWLLDAKPGGGAAVCHAALDAQVIPV